MATYSKIDSNTVKESVLTERAISAEMLTQELDTAKNDLAMAQAKYDAVKAKVAKIKLAVPTMDVVIPK